MGNHGRYHRGHILYKLRIINLNQVIDTWTAGGNNIFHLLLLQKPGILCRDKGCPLSGLPHILKPQADQSGANLADGLVF